MISVIDDDLESWIVKVNRCTYVISNALTGETSALLYTMNNSHGVKKQNHSHGSSYHLCDENNIYDKITR